METAAIGFSHAVGHAKFLCHDGVREGDSNRIKAVENQRRSFAESSSQCYGDSNLVFEFLPELVQCDTEAANIGESDSAIAERIQGFLAWLGRREERQIAVVGHALIF